VPAGRSEARAKLDIGIYIALLPPEHHGGAELQADRLARELAARGHRVHVFARRQPGRTAAEVRAGVQVDRRLVLPIPGVRAAVDLVLGVAQALRARPRLLLCYMTFNNGVLGAVAGALLRVPFVIWQRLEGESVLGVSALHRHAAVALEARAAGVWLQAQAFVATLEREYRRAGRTAAWERLRPRLRVVGNGLDAPAQVRPGTPAPPWRALFVGRLTAQKDLPTLLSAARRVPGCEIWIVGEGPLRSALEAAAPPSVRFLGPQPHARVAELWRESRALVLCSTTEGIPNVVLEALAHACPVIATPVGAIPEFVRDGVNGWIVPVGDVDALAAALAGLQDEVVWRARAGAAPAAVADCAWPALVARVESELAALQPVTEGAAT
jgi:glycosyltransferase involved in cell wall biosynthesis